MDLRSRRTTTMSYLIMASMIVSSYVFFIRNISGHDKITKLYAGNSKESYDIVNGRSLLSCSADNIAFDACSDSKAASDPSTSTISLKGGPFFRLGENIILKVQSFDGYNKPKSVGGDHLRARMLSTDVNAFSSGSVHDNFDGTYTIVFTALWTGQIYLEVELLYPREVISAVYRTRNEKGTGLCKYSLKNISRFEDLRCVYKDTKSGQIEYLESERSVCNITFHKRGTELMYCHKKKVSNNVCKAWKRRARFCWTMDHPLSNCEKELAERQKFVIGSNVNITVISVDGRQRIVDSPRVPCTRYSTKNLWSKDRPTGFFYEGIWLLRFCQGGKTNIGLCLQNKTILFHGDSTLNQWRSYILQNIALKCTYRPVNHRACYSEKFNFTFIWVPRDTTPKNMIFEYYSEKLMRKLDIADKRFQLIVVVNMFLHFQLSEFSLFKAHLIALRQHFIEILKEFLSAKLFIKLPHTHRPFELDLLEKYMMIGNSDYIGFIYNCFINDVFKGLYDKVIVLDNKDATIALQNKLTHPETPIVAAMVKQLMNYICFIPDDMQIN